MATAHLICGFLGAGKTTYSRTLAARTRAVRLSIDELYLGLFADGPTYELDVAARDRLLAVLDELWPQVLGVGADVVLDFGFWSRRQRETTRSRAEAVGAQTQLHWLRCPDSIALQRCLARNGDPAAFLISAEGFTEMKRRFETPVDQEGALVVETGEPG